MPLWALCRGGARTLRNRANEAGDTWGGVARLSRAHLVSPPAHFVGSLLNVPCARHPQQRTHEPAPTCARARCSGPSRPLSCTPCPPRPARFGGSLLNVPCARHPQQRTHEPANPRPILRAREPTSPRNPRARPRRSAHFGGSLPNVPCARHPQQRTHEPATYATAPRTHEPTIEPTT